MRNPMKWCFHLGKVACGCMCIQALSWSFHQDSLEANASILSLGKAHGRFRCWGLESLFPRMTGWSWCSWLPRVLRRWLQCVWLVLSQQDPRGWALLIVVSHLGWAAYIARQGWYGFSSCARWRWCLQSELCFDPSEYDGRFPLGSSPKLVEHLKHADLGRF